MKKILVSRFASNDNATLSVVFMPDGRPFCFGLEDPYREIKAQSITRIPAGIYKITLRKEGGMHQRYKKNFDFHQGMLWIRDVPGYEYVLIHIGNNSDDTAGCLLIGYEADSANSTIKKSAACYKDFYLHVVDAAKAGDLCIEFVNNDKPVV